MTGMPQARRPVDVLGIIAIVVAAIVLVPSIGILLIGLIPEMNAIWWLGIVVIPLAGIAGAIAIVLGIIGIVVAVRRGGRYVVSIVGIVLGVLAALPIALLALQGGF